MRSIQKIIAVLFTAMLLLPAVSAVDTLVTAKVNGLFVNGAECPALLFETITATGWSGATSNVAVINWKVVTGTPAVTTTVKTGGQQISKGDEISLLAKSGSTTLNIEAYKTIASNIYGQAVANPSTKCCSGGTCVATSAPVQERLFSWTFIVP